MPSIKKLSDNVSTGPWLDQADFSTVKDQGFGTVVNFRPDGEVGNQITSEEAKAAAEAAGLVYAHIPVTKNDLFTDDVIDKATAALAGPGPVLVYCASGLRSAIVWAAIEARSRPVPEVIHALREAGFDLAFIRDDLDAQADRARWSGSSAGAAA